jgi:hypothetical protein
VVCLAGPIDSPVVVERSRLLLTSGPLPNEPYHRAKARPVEEATEVVASASREARLLASQAISSLVGDLAVRGYRVETSAVLLGSGRPDFTLTQALATHASMHNAEGWLHREAVMAASRNHNLRVAAARERDVYALASVAIGLSETELRERLADLGGSVGPPWTLDQKLAAAAAWLALAGEEHGNLQTNH